MREFINILLCFLTNSNAVSIKHRYSGTRVCGIEYLMIFRKDFTSRLNDVDNIYNL